MSEIIITDSLLDKLLQKDNYQDKTINNVLYKFLGKGGDGIVFLSQNRVIKIYTRVIMNTILKEFYVVGLLQELKYINQNVIHIDRYYLSTKYPVLIMEPMDGSLEDFCEIAKNINNDMIWLSMIFQITYGLMFLNKLGILHNDTKSKNILYAKTSKTEFEYNIDGIKYKIPTNNYVFKIADFGAIQIHGSTLNTLSDTVIQQYLDQREDLYELSRLWFRILVNYARKYITIDILKPLIESNKDFKKYYEEQKIDINKKLNHMPQKIKDNMILRSLIYYGIENNIIDETEIIKKYNLSKPSEIVLKTLNGLVDMNIKNVFDLFKQFKA
jgi:serine/threonine protein kinase